MAIAEIIYQELKYLSDNEKRIVLPRFFKTGKGEYGEGDKFIGVTVPNIRSVAVIHIDLSMDDIDKLLCSEWHEMRMCGLMIMVERSKLTRKRNWIKAHTEEEGERKRKELFDFYLSHTNRINNWDLVDLTAPILVGGYLQNKNRNVLYKLANSHLLWEQRIAVVSTLTFIRDNDFCDIYALAEFLLHHTHDLMQKAVGWMLREAGKRDKPMLMDFLDLHYKTMPRTMLRYAIEKFTDNEREYYMRKNV